MPCAQLLPGDFLHCTPFDDSGIVQGQNVEVRTVVFELLVMVYLVFVRERTYEETCQWRISEYNDQSNRFVDITSIIVTAQYVCII